MNIVLLGPPGVGKGTQAKNIEKHFMIPHVSTGDLVRKTIECNSEINITLKRRLETGLLISDTMISTILRKRITQSDCNNGFILDGFPRNIAQANILKKLGVNINYVVEITLDDAEIIKRVSGRFIHEPSGRSYHIKNNPPKIYGKDDLTNESLVQRIDDKPEVIAQRLTTYYSKTTDVMAYYQKFDNANNQYCNSRYIKVDGKQSIDKITQDIINQLTKIS